jgi:uncharacterized protein (DUF2236 family)
VVDRRPPTRRAIASTKLREAAGLYGPDSESWRVNREGVLLLASGPRALLLQLAHPLIAEGVNQHSDFRRDPWTRLERTVRSYLRIVYGSSSLARQEIRRLNGFHRAIVGPIEDPANRARWGDHYDARDPELSLWVHATLVESVATAYEAWVEPLSPDARRRLYEESRPIGRAFGISDRLLPADVDAFDAYFAGMLAPGGPVHPSPKARELARYVLHPTLDALVPVLGWVPPQLYAWLQWPAIALLPPRLRAEFEIPWGPEREAVAAWLKAGLQLGMAISPNRLRWFPQARRAYDRVAAAASVAAGEEGLREGGDVEGRRAVERVEELARPGEPEPVVGEVGS